MNKKIFNTAFTMGATHVNRLYLQRIAFTMAEILLSLTIIGVVAAITLPSLTGNINERTWKTQRKALYARMSQAIALMGNINGYGIGATNDQTNSFAAKVFVSEGLSKVLKINNICDSEHLQDCGIPEKFVKPLNMVDKTTFPTDLHTWNPKFSASTNPHNFVNTKAVAFETANGESIAVFYNPYCVSKDVLFPSSDTSSNYYYQPYMCANFIYDLNGKKGPNRVGSDIGAITAMYSGNTEIVAPMIINRNLWSQNGNYNTAMAACKTYGDYKVPNVDELAALFYNYRLFIYNSDYMNGDWVTSTIVKVPGRNYENAWHLQTAYSYKRALGAETTTNKKFTCIER